MKTPTRPSGHWLWLSHTSGSRAWVPSAIRNEWEKITVSAATSRRKSKLLACELVTGELVAGRAGSAVGIKPLRLGAAARMRNIPLQKEEPASITVAEPVLIRPAQPADGAALIAAAAAIDAETEFLGVAGQRHPWAERPEAELRSLAENKRGVVLLALTADGAIVGYLSAFLGHFTRNRGNLFIAVVGLREAYRGQGIGTRLFETVEAWARERGVWRLELRVSSLNERGQALYRKRGFAVEGSIRGGVFRRGAWTDDFWMGKLIEPLPGRPLATAGTEGARISARASRTAPRIRPMRGAGLDAPAEMRAPSV